MPRKPAVDTRDPSLDEVVDIQAITAAGTALSVMSAQALALQQQFGLEDMTPGTLVREIRTWIDHSARAMFEVGIRLAALRTVVAHGEWMPILQEQIGMSPRTAQRMISAAVKCSAEQGRREKLLQLSRSKVLELVSLDDEHLDELEATGSIAQLALEFDEIDRMSVAELRRRLREREQEMHAKQRRIDAQRAQIDKLEDAMHAPFAADASAASAEERRLLDGVRDRVVAIELALAQLAAVLPRAADGTLSDACGLAMRQSAEYLAQRLADVLNDAGVDVQFEERVTPEWLRKAGAGKARHTTSPARSAS